MLKNYISFFIFFLLGFSLFSTEKKTESSSQKITIYWDTSLSMRDKDIEKEIEFLNNYFKNVTETRVRLISFSNTINVNDTFNITNSDWANLKTTLLKTKYDGIACYDLMTNKESDLNMVFTDGFEVLDKFNIETLNNTYIVNSNKNSNEKLLIEQSERSGGSYIDLYNTSIKNGLSLILKKNVDVVLIKKTKIVQKLVNNESDLITGSVFSSEGVLIGAVIKIEDKPIGVVTDINGNFQIKAEKGDVLVVNYIGMYSKKITVENAKILDILLLDNEKEMKGIEIKGAKIIDDELVDLGGRKIEKRKLGYAVQTIKGDELSDARTDNINLQGRISGVSHYGQNDDISKIVLRANSILSNVFPLIVIDGNPIARSSSVGSSKLSNFIDPNNISEIKILKGLAATNRWGSEGSNGVILVTTKVGDYSNSSDEKPYDEALVKGNDYEDNLSQIDTMINEGYLEELKKKDNLDEMYDFYLAQRIPFLDDIQYFTNVSSYVIKKGNPEMSLKILSNILEYNSNNADILRYVAYMVKDNYKLSIKIYKKIIALKPNESQSYKDLALAYQESGNYQQALGIYNKIVNNKFSNINFSGLKKSILNDMKRMILLNKKKMKLKNVPSEFSNPKKFNYDARIVFDWNKKDAEFDLQFVNPQKKFFTWEHSYKGNSNRLNIEKSQGFSSEEFLLIDSEKGEWLINIENKINKNENPIVIKCTIYRNFGEAKETIEEIRVILNNIKERQILAKIKI